MNKKKSVFAVLLVIVFMVSSMGLPQLVLFQSLQKPLPKTLERAPEAKAENAYISATASVTTGIQTNHHSYTQIADTFDWRILTTASGLDATVTFSNVALNSANVLYVNYNGSASSASLTYEIQIRDFTAGTWRTINPHATTLANVTDQAAGLLYQPTAAVAGMGQIAIYDGYFSNGSNSPVSIPLSDFVNDSNEVQIRFLSATVTPNLEMRIDYLSVEPAIENMKYASSMTTAAGTVSNEYNDTTTDDNTTNLSIAATASGIDTYLSFTNMPTPYTGANVILVEYSGNDDASLSDYSIQVRDFTNGQWDTLNGTVLNSATDTTHYFATSTAQAVTDYISGNEIRIRFVSTDTSGTLNIDFARVTIGSVMTNTGFYIDEISRGSVSSGSETNMQTIDTTSAASSWVLSTSASDVTATTQYPGDCNAATNNCVGVNLQLPVTVPSNTMVTGVHTMFRYNTSSANIDMEFGIRNVMNGNMAVTTAVADETSLQSMRRELSYPMPPQVGTDPLVTVPVYEPEYYVNTINDAINFYARSAASSASGTLTLDFVFVSIRYLGPYKSVSNRWVPTGATITNGTNNASNFRYANRDDSNYYSVTPSGSGTDYYLSFSNVEIPTNANKIIIDTRARSSAASQTYEIYLYDFVNTTWREVTPHSTNYTSDGTLSTEELVQVEVYDGYFSNASDAPVSTPISNFVSSSQMRVRYVMASTTNRLEIDWVNVEIANDPVYFAADSTITNGTITNEYNDTTTDDATTSYTITNSSGIDFYLSFKNVLTPPTGADTAYLHVSSHMTAGAGSYTISLYNFNTTSWVPFNGTVLTHTSDRTDYYFLNISNWAHYISGNEMRVRFNSASAGGTIVVDYAKLALGSVTNSTVGQTIDLGGTYVNSYSETATLDTSNFVALENSWGIRSHPNTQSAEALEAPASIALTVNYPLTVPTNVYPSGIIWAMKGSSNATTISPTVSFTNTKIGTRVATNARGVTLALNALPNAGDLGTFASTTEVMREGWFIENTANALLNEQNMVQMRIRTTASTLLGPAYFMIDAGFVALRYAE